MGKSKNQAQNRPLILQCVLSPPNYHLEEHSKVFLSHVWIWKINTFALSIENIIQECHYLPLNNFSSCKAYIHG